MASTMSTRHFILGLLARQPMSGYDIKRFLHSLNWLVDSPSFGTLYPALHALLADGLVTMEVVPSEGRPPRKIYTITDAGGRVLQRWMDQPVDSDASLKTFVMRLTLANHLSPADLRAYLEQRRAQVAAHRLALERAIEAVDEGIDVGERLTLDYGLSLATAELAWLDRTLARLSQPSLLAEVAENTEASFATLTA
jgi:PadR family transcriptional regulator AphA